MSDPAKMTNEELAAALEAIAVDIAQPIEEHDKDLAAIDEAARVIAWARSSPRPDPAQAFTAGPERQAAYWIEWAEKEAANG